MEDITFENMPMALSQLCKQVDRIENMLKNINPEGKEDVELMNVQEAAEYLKLTVPAIYTKVSRREIPVSKPGRRLYFLKSDLIDWANGARLKTREELARNAEIKMKNYRKHRRF